MFKRYGYLCVIQVCVTMLLAQSLAAQTTKPAAKKFDITISKETTYFLGPVLPDGTIDYIAAFNQRSSKGVTKDNNAAIGIIKAMGPEFIHKGLRAETFAKLGMSKLPEKGDYFVGHDKFIADTKEFWLQGKKVRGRAWNAEESPTLAKWINANEKPLAVIAKAVRKDRFFIPLAGQDGDFHSAWKMNHLRIGKFQDVVVALALRATLKMGSDDVKGAWSDVFLIFKLSELISQGPSPGDRFSRMWCYQYVSGASCVILTSDNTSPVQAKQYNMKLQELTRAANMSDFSGDFMRAAYLSYVMTMMKKGPGYVFDMLNLRPGKKSDDMDEWAPVRDRIDWDALLRNTNETYDKFIGVLTSSPGEKRSATWESMGAQRKSEMGIIWRRDYSDSFRGIPGLGDVVYAAADAYPPNAEGDVMLTADVRNAMIAWLIPSGSKVDVDRFDSIFASTPLCSIDYALLTHKAVTGDYPKTLDELVPKYIKKIPNDHFSGKAPIYRLKENGGYWLYSVGPNLKDDGGTGASGCDDIVFSNSFDEFEEDL